MAQFAAGAKPPAAKADDCGFTKALAREGARFGVTVSTIFPGYIATDMAMTVPGKMRESIIDQIPVGRPGEAAEIARYVVFLGGEARPYAASFSSDFELSCALSIPIPGFAGSGSLANGARLRPDNCMAMCRLKNGLMLTSERARLRKNRRTGFRASAISVIFPAMASTSSAAGRRSFS